MAVCPQCGSSIGEVDKFCKECGMSLAKDYQRQRKISRTSASRKSIQNRGGYDRKRANGRIRRAGALLHRGKGPDALRMTEPNVNMAPVLS